mmetsp:Transcript_14439/g.14962  ORF Transcript_14439/g.14962 Transcript_14439/m.14962 type:complete len:105 (-) Transcript_14439:135-449(-)
MIKSLDEFTKYKDSTGVVFFDFFAEWCTPCKFIAPKVNKLMSSYPKITFCKVDVDSHEDIMEKEGVEVMPTFKLYKDGELLGESFGSSIEKVSHIVSAQYKSLK